MTANINRHPGRSMASSLRQLADRADAMSGPDMYGRGELIEAFEARMAAMLGKPAALFLPSGTLAQPMALRIHADRRGKSTIGLHPTSHIILHEQDGYQQLWGLKGQRLGQANTVLTRDDFPDAPPADMAAMVLELPMREIGGQLPEWDDLLAQVTWARQHGIAVHIDGARLWQCPAYYGQSLERISALADSVYLSFYKDIGGIAGALLAGDSTFIAQARIWSRRAGGNLIALYPYILAAEQGLEDNLDCMADAVAYARELGTLLASLPGVRCHPTPPQAAMFHLHIDVERECLTAAIAEYTRQNDVVVLPDPRAVDGDGRSVCEISVGRSTMAHPPSFWLSHLESALAMDGMN